MSAECAEKESHPPLWEWEEDPHTSSLSLPKILESRSHPHFMYEKHEVQSSWATDLTSHSRRVAELGLGPVLHPPSHSEFPGPPAAIAAPAQT